MGSSTGCLLATRRRKLVLMKKFIASIFLTAAAPATAQQATYDSSMWISAPCDKTNLVANDITSGIGAAPLLTANGIVDFIDQDGQQQNTRGFYTLWANQEQALYATTITFPDGVTCVLSSGTDFEPFVK